MYLLVSILKQTQPLSDIVAGFANIGITGSTVLNGTGMGRVLCVSIVAQQQSKTVEICWKCVLEDMFKIVCVVDWWR